MQRLSQHYGPVDRSKRASADRSTMSSEFLQLDVAEAPRGAASAWLAGRVTDAIASGALPVGARLPTTRDLAAELGVSRGVVTEAYRRLAEGGHVVGRGRAGTVVAHAPPPTSPAPPTPPRPVRFAEPDLGVFGALRAAEASIDLTPGVPDLAAFPRSAWLRSERAVLHDLPAGGLGYADPAGVPVFRAAVAAWLARLTSLDAFLTLIQVLFWNVWTARSALAWALVVLGCTGPLLASLFFRRTRLLAL